MTAFFPLRARSTPAWPAIAALLVGTLVRTLPLQANRFHPDEALYSTFARSIGSGRDLLLWGMVVDKPPLAFYLGGLTSLLIGGNELAMRLPALWASLLSIALLWALGRRLYGRPVAHLAAWLLALSPFAILFSITVFIDPLLTMFCLWGLWMAARDNARWTAVAFTCAFATKQTALMMAPLALALTWLHLPAAADGRAAARQLGRTLGPMVLGWLGVTGLLMVWDVIRHAPVGFWQQGYSDNMPGRWIRANEVWPRARAGLDLLQYATATPWLNGILMAGWPLWLLRPGRPRSRTALTDIILTGYSVLFLAAYWLLAFNLWDRYLVPLIPLLLLLLARLVTGVGAHWRVTLSRVTLPGWALASLAAGLLLVPAAGQAAQSAYPIGGDHGAYDGIDRMARYVRTLPAESVLYDHWLSWELDFYLFDRPLYVAWFPTPAALATDLQAFGHTTPRYLIVPSWEAEAEMRTAAETAGFQFQPRYTTTRRDGTVSFTLYQLTPVTP